MDLNIITTGLGTSIIVLYFYVFYIGAVYEQHIQKHLEQNTINKTPGKKINCELLEKQRIYLKNSFSCLLVFICIFFTLLLLRIFQINNEIFYVISAQIALGLSLTTGFALWRLRKNYKSYIKAKPDSRRQEKRADKNNRGKYKI